MAEGENGEERAEDSLLLTQKPGEKLLREKKSPEQGFSVYQLIIVGALFFLFFAVVWTMKVGRGLINAVPFLNVWLNLFLTVPEPLQSPMFFVMFFAGFFVIFFLVDWVNSHFNTKQALHPLFVLLFFFFCLLAFYVALFWHFENYAVNADRTLLICVSDDLGWPFGTCNDILNGLITQGKQQEYLFVDYWERLHGSGFIFFIWGGAFGWITRFAVGKIKL